MNDQFRSTGIGRSCCLKNLPKDLRNAGAKRLETGRHARMVS